MVTRTGWTALLLVGLCLLSLGAGLGASAERTFDVRDGIELPSQSYSTQWGSYDVDSAVRIDGDGNVRLTSSVPDDDYHQVRIVDSDENQIRYDAARGDSTFRFDFRNLEYGTYAIAMTNGTDTVYHVVPMVVRGYDTAIDAPSETANDTIDVTVSLSEAASNPESPSAVTVTFGNDSMTETVTASETGGSTYAATVSVDEFQPGSYTVYAKVEGSESAFGHPEAIGLSKSATVSLQKATPTTTTTTTTATTATTTTTTTSSTTSASTATTTSGATQGDGGAGGLASSGGNGSTTRSPTETTATTATATPQSTTPATPSTTDTTTSTSAPATSLDPDETTAATDTAEPTTATPSTRTADGPSEETETGTGGGANTTSTTGPTWSPLGYVGALLVGSGTLLWTRRRTGR